MWWSLRIWYCVLFVTHYGVSGQSFVWFGWVCALAFDDDWRGNIKWRLHSAGMKSPGVSFRVSRGKNGSSWSNFMWPRKKYVEPVKILVVCQSPSPSPPPLHHYRIRRAGRSRFDRCHTEFEWHCVLGWVDLGVLGKKCFDFFGLQETVSRNSYMTTGLYRYSLAQPAILPPAQHMRGTSNTGSFNLSLPKRIFDE